MKERLFFWSRQFFIQKNQVHSVMLCIAKTASCFQVSPGAVQLHSLVVAGEIFPSYQIGADKNKRIAASFPRCLIPVEPEGKLFPYVLP